jgi:putative membrane protein
MIKHLMPAAAMAATVCLAVPGMASAGQSSSSSPQTRASSQTQARASSAPTAADRSFIRKAAEGGLAEVQLGQLAQQKASSQKVKDFGQRMIDDHSKANDQLKQIAQQHNVTVPSALAGAEKTEYARLSKLSGDQFDRAYMKLMLEDHQKDVSEFQKASKAASDPQVKEFAESTLPTLQQHLNLARQTAAAVGAGTTPTTGTTRRPATGTTGTSPQPPAPPAPTTPDTLSRPGGDVR